MAKGRKTQIGKGCAVFVHGIYQANDYSLKKTEIVFGITSSVLKKSMKLFGLEVKDRPNFWKDGGAVCGMCKVFKSCDHYTVTTRDGRIHRASGYCVDCNKIRRKRYFYECVKGEHGDEKKRKIYAAIYNHNEKRNRLKKESFIENIDPDIVFSRDNWICYICGVKTERSKEYKPNRATLDHVIALTKGGLHTYDNVKCCCNKCNIRKGNK